MRRPLLATLLMVGALTLPALAQPVTSKSPNVEGTWVPEPGLDFSFTHRFTYAGKVTNFPTFTLGTGLWWPGLAVGAKYASNSGLVSNAPNELEFWLKDRFLSEDAGHPLSASITGGYNLMATSVDGELSAERRFGPVRLTGTLRGFSNLAGSGRAGAAGGGGIGVQLTEHLWLAGDVTKTMTTADPLAWGLGLHAVVPYSPHTLALQVTNANTTTRQGSSIGTGNVHFGFEFSIPFTSGARWAAILFPPKPEPEEAPAPAPSPKAPKADKSKAASVPSSDAAAGPVTTPQAVTITIRNMAFSPAVVTVPVGSTVTWLNQEEQILHSTSSNATLWEQYLMPKQTFSRTFDQAGTYKYHCVPHPMMTGTIVVQ